MSLHFDLRLGRTGLGFVEIQRLTNTDEVTLPDSAISTYEVRLDDRVLGQVQHRYGNGAWALVRAALELIP
jgi:hypothetical protein